MLLRLAARNTVRNLPRLRPMVLVLIVAFAVLVPTNGIFEYADRRFEAAYVDHLSGDATIGAASDVVFSLFGAQTLLVGEYLVPPTIADVERVEEVLRRHLVVDAFPEPAPAVDSLDMSDDLALPQTSLPSSGVSVHRRARGVVADYTFVVTSAARAGGEVGSADLILFGVDFSDYARFFSDIRVTGGGWPADADAGTILLQPDSARALFGDRMDLGDASGGDKTGGDGFAGDDPSSRRVVLTAQVGDSFAIREVVVRGIYEYPVEGAALSNVALVDADTARALNGYVHGAGEVVPVGERTGELLSADIDDLFAEADDHAAPFGGPNTTRTAPEGVSSARRSESEHVAEPEPDAGAGAGAELDSLLADVERLFQAVPAGEPEAHTGAETDPSEPSASPPNVARVPADAAEAAGAPVATAWNYALVRAHEGGAAAALTQALRSAFAGDDAVLVRDWRRSVGGEVSIVSSIRILINAGIVFVIAGATIVATNAIVLSLLERTREIGTLRALGAGRLTVGALLSVETVLVVFGSAVVGVGVGLLAGVLVGRGEIVPQNQYFAILFGGGPIAGHFPFALVAAHIAGGLGVALLSLVYPLVRALRITPLQAMRG